MPVRAKPYFLTFPLNAVKMEQIDEMFRILFDDVRNGNLTITLEQLDIDLEIGDILYVNGSETLDGLTVGADDTVLRSNGTLPVWGKVDLTTDIAGILPLSNGGTGSGTALGAFNNLSPLTTKGDLLGHTGASNVRFPIGVDGQVLTANSATTTGLEWIANAGGDVVGPASATDNAITRFDGTTGKLIQNSGITIADGATGTLSGTNSGDVTLAGTPDYITIAGQVITRGLIDLATDVTGDLPYANLVQATAATRLLGRGSASGAGDWQEITLGTGLAMTGTVLSASGAGDVVGPASATDDALVRFDGTTGKLIQNSNAILDNTGNLTLASKLVVTADTNADGIDVRGRASDNIGEINFYNNAGSVLFGGMRFDSATLGRIQVGTTLLASLTTTAFSPAADNTFTDGTSSLRWANVFAVNGNFSNTVQLITNDANALGLIIGGRSSDNIGQAAFYDNTVSTFFGSLRFDSATRGYINVGNTTFYAFDTSFLFPLADNAQSLGTTGGTWSKTFGGTYVERAIAPTLSATTANWNPTGLATAGWIRADVTGSPNLSGLVAQEHGRNITLTNVGAGTVTLLHDNVGSVAANRFLISGASSKTMVTNTSALLIYDATTSRWRVLVAAA